MITQFLVRYCVSSLDFSENVNVTQYIVGKKNSPAKNIRRQKLAKFLASDEIFFVKWYIVKASHFEESFSGCFKNALVSMV